MNQNSVLGDSVLSSRYFNPDYLFSRGSEFLYKFYHSGVNTEVLSLYNATIFFLAFFFLTIIAYATIRLFEIRAKERRHLEHEIAEYAQLMKEMEKKKAEGEEVSKNPRWLKTLSYLFSQHGSDWKLAVIEADSMLEELMNELGFAGETLGEKLKSARQENFRELTQAWEAHTLRNRIAHEGASFELSQREAKRAISLYEDIFRAYGFI